MIHCIAQNKDKTVTNTAKACKKTKPSQKKKNDFPRCLCSKIRHGLKKKSIYLHNEILYQ